MPHTANAVPETLCRGSLTRAVGHVDEQLAIRAAARDALVVGRERDAGDGLILSQEAVGLWEERRGAHISDHCEFVINAFFLGRECPIDAADRLILSPVKGFACIRSV